MKSFWLALLPGTLALVAVAYLAGGFWAAVLSVGCYVFGWASHKHGAEAWRRLSFPRFWG